LLRLLCLSFNTPAGNYLELEGFGDVIMPSKKTTHTIFISAVILLATVLGACRFASFTYRGITVAEEDIIVLEEGGPHAEVWKTEDLAVKYSYHKEADRLKFSGLIDFDDSLKYNFTRLDTFDLWIHFLDAENTILAYHYLSPRSLYHEIIEIPFDIDFALPPGTRSISFSYEGFASEGGSNRLDPQGGGTSWYFWRTP
jgi:hypothetical protein